MQILPLSLTCLPASLRKKKADFRVDCGHLVIFGLGDLDDGLLQHLADGVDGDVRPADGGDGIGEQLLDRARRGQVTRKATPLAPVALMAVTVSSAAAFVAALL